MKSQLSKHYPVFWSKNLGMFVTILGLLVHPLIAFSDIAAPPGWQDVNHYVVNASKPNAKELDRASGFIPYTRNCVDPVFSYSRPQTDEVTDSFTVTLAREEYEPLIVALFALEDAGNINLRIQNVKSSDSTLQNDQFEIRKIEPRAILPPGRKKGEKRYQLIPSVLKLMDTANLRKGQTTAFWITVHALKKNPPGKYKGQIVISANGNVLRKLLIEVFVLPFVLEEIPDKTFAILYTPGSLAPEMERNARILLRDMRTHGMTAYSPVVSAWGQPLSFNKNGTPKVETLLNHLRWAHDEGFREPTILNVQKVIRTGRPGLDAGYDKFNESIDLPNLKNLVNFLEKERRNNRWPEIVYLPIDEPGCFTDRAGTRREELAVILLKKLHGLNVRGATTVADLVDNKHRRLPRWKNVAGWWNKIKPFCAVRIYANGFPEGKTSLVHEMEDAAASGHQVMLYENTSTMGTDPRISRLYFGFYGWRTGVSGITSWTHPTLGYATINNIWEDEEKKQARRKEFFSNENWQLPPSTVCWEMVREGVDDAKYIYLFQKLAAQAKHLPAEYSQLIRELQKDIDSTEMSAKRPQCNWSGKHFSDYRKRIIQAMLDLNGSKGLN